LNEGEVKSTHARERVPFLERATHPRSSHLDINTLPSPRILKTHLLYNIIPKGTNKDSKCKYIYLARNPKDVAVSFFQFVTSMKRYNGPWEFYAKLFVEGNGEKVFKSVFFNLHSFAPTPKLARSSLPPCEIFQELAL